MSVMSIDECLAWSLTDKTSALARSILVMPVSFKL